MQREYQDFIAALRAELLKKEGFAKNRYRFPEEEDSLGGDDRLYIECGQVKEVSQVCSFPIASLYRDYQKNRDIVFVSDEIIKELDRMDHQVICDIALHLKDYEKIKNRLFVRLLNYENNKESLRTAVYRRMEDIAQTLYVRMGVKKGVFTSAKVQKELLEIWGKGEEEVFEYAILNTCFLTPPRVYKWEKILFDSSYDGDNFMDAEQPGVLAKGPGGNCISTTGKTNGAVAVFLPGVLQRISDVLESDLYLAFTSIHEVMVHSTKYIAPDELREVLESTIRECTPSDEFLSYNIFFYSRKSGQLFCIKSEKGQGDYGQTVVFA